MAKADRDVERQRGEKLLREWGVADAADLATLTTHVGKDVAADVAIAARLGAIVDADSATLLRRIEATGDKSAVKEARRSLLRLEQKGVMAPPAEVAPTPSILSVAEPLEGWITPVDGRGDYLIWLERRTTAGSDFLFAVLNDPEGLRELELMHASRKDMKDARQRMLEQNQIELLSVDWRYCDFLVRRASQWSEDRKQPVGDYARARIRFTHEPARDVDNPAAARFAAVADDPMLVAESAALLGEREFRTWFLTREDLQPYVDAFQQIRDSPLVLNRSQQQERITGLVERAIGEIFAGERQQSWVRRLEIMSLFFLAARREPTAKMAYAVSRALAASTTGARGIPFFAAMARAALSAHFQMAEREDQEASRSSLVLTPGQAIREAESRKSR